LGALFYPHTHNNTHPTFHTPNFKQTKRNPFIIMAIEDEMKDVQQLVVNQLGVANGLNNSLADGQVTPAKMSTGAPTWGTDGRLFINSGHIEINPNLVGDSNAYVDFHSTSASNPDNDARIVKVAGENSDFSLQNSGTGGTTIFQDGVAKFRTHGGTEGYTKITAGGTGVNDGANIELYGGTHATEANNAFYDANRHRFRSAAGGISPSYIDMHMTDEGDAELRVSSSDSSGEANLKVSSYTPSIILEDKTTNSTDFQIIADGGSLKFKSGDTSGDALLANTINRISSDGSMSFGRDGMSVNNAEAGVVCSSSGYLYVARAGTATQTHVSFINNATATPTPVGNIVTSGSTTSFNTSSDYRLKEDIVDMEGSIERLKELKPCNFRWKSDGTRVDGFIAHEAQEVVPESVSGTKDALDEEGNPEYQGIDQSKLVPLLTKALQEAVAKIEALEARITALEA
jgi:hypothetical protein